MAARERDSGRAEAMPRKGMVASGSDAEERDGGERSEQCLGEARLWLAPHS